MHSQITPFFARLANHRILRRSLSLLLLLPLGLTVLSRTEMPTVHAAPQQFQLACKPQTGPIPQWPLILRFVVPVIEEVAPLILLSGLPDCPDSGTPFCQSEVELGIQQVDPRKRYMVSSHLVNCFVVASDGSIHSYTASKIFVIPDLFYNGKGRNRYNTPVECHQTYECSKLTQDRKFLAPTLDLVMRQALASGVWQATTRGEAYDQSGRRITFLNNPITLQVTYTPVGGLRLRLSENASPESDAELATNSLASSESTLDSTLYSDDVWSELNPPTLLADDSTLFADDPEAE